MSNGIAQVVQNLTTDHALAAKALRLPLGNPGASASPYFSLEDLLKRWPASDEHREVLMTPMASTDTGVAVRTTLLRATLPSIIMITLVHSEMPVLYTGSKVINSE